MKTTLTREELKEMGYSVWEKYGKRRTYIVNKAYIDHDNGDEYVGISDEQAIDFENSLREQYEEKLQRRAQRIERWDREEAEKQRDWMNQFDEQYKTFDYTEAWKKNCGINGLSTIKQIVISASEESLQETIDLYMEKAQRKLDDNLYKNFKWACVARHMKELYEEISGNSLAEIKEFIEENKTDPFVGTTDMIPEVRGVKKLCHGVMPEKWKIYFTDEEWEHL